MGDLADRKRQMDELMQGPSFAQEMDTPRSRMTRLNDGLSTSKSSKDSAATVEKMKALRAQYGAKLKPTRKKLLSGE